MWHHESLVVINFFVLFLLCELFALLCELFRLLLFCGFIGQVSKTVLCDMNMGKLC